MDRSNVAEQDHHMDPFDPMSSSDDESDEDDEMLIATINAVAAALVSTLKAPRKVTMMVLPGHPKVVESGAAK